MSNDWWARETSKISKMCNYENRLPQNVQKYVNIDTKKFVIQLRFRMCINLWYHVTVRFLGVSFSTNNLLRPVINWDEQCLPQANNCEWSLKTFRMLQISKKRCIEITGKEYDSFYIPVRKLLWWPLRSRGKRASPSWNPPGDFNIFSFIVCFWSFNLTRSWPLLNWLA